MSPVPAIFPQTFRVPNLGEHAVGFGYFWLAGKQVSGVAPWAAF